MILGIILSWYSCIPGSIPGQNCAMERVARFVRNKKQACAVVRKEDLGESFNAAYVFVDEALNAATIRTRDIDLVCGDAK
jgi:hypothetical protein